MIASEALLEFMEKEHSEENLHFLLAVQDLNRKYPQSGMKLSRVKKVSQAAIKIFERFIDPKVSITFHGMIVLSLLKWCDP